MTANDIVGDARVARVRELKAALAEAKAQFQQAEAERDVLAAHFHLALVALRDFEQVGQEGRLHIVDGWNAILRDRNVSKLTTEDISRLKADYLANLGAVRPHKADVCGLHSLSLTSPADGAANGSQPLNLSTSQPLTCWIVFDGPEENSYRSGNYRVTYTGGTGSHRADRLILDYVHAAKLLGLDTSRITVETADKAFAQKVIALGAKVVAPDCTPPQTPVDRDAAI